MFKLVVFFALIAVAMAGVLLQQPLTYSAAFPTYAENSAYAYGATVQTPDYVNHQEVKSIGPLARTYVSYGAAPFIGTFA